MSGTINKILTIDIGRNTTNKIENSGEVVFPKFRTLSPNENRLKLEENLRLILEEKDKAMESLDYLDYLEELEDEVHSLNSANKYNVFEIVSSAFNSSAPESSSSSEFSSNL